MAKLIEKVYGEALFALAIEEKREKELLEEVQAVRQILDENPELSKLMLLPGVPENEKEEILHQVWDGRVSREIEGLMLLLLKKEHYAQLPLVFDYFLAAVREKEGIGTAYVKTAVPLSDMQKEKIRKRLLETTSYKSFDMNYEVDESLIGGIVIRIGDRVVDSSIRTKLDTLSRQLYQVRLQ